MMIIPILCLFFKRRHFALNSKIFNAGVSSINMGACASAGYHLHTVVSFHALPVYLGQFFPAIFHFPRKNTLYQLACTHFQTENKATGVGLLGCRAALRARFNANAVLPTEGLAARMIRSVLLPSISDSVQTMESHSAHQ